MLVFEVRGLLYHVGAFAPDQPRRGSPALRMCVPPNPLAAGHLTQEGARITLRFLPPHWDFPRRIGDGETGAFLRAAAYVRRWFV